MNFSETIHQVRKGKGMKLKEAAGDALSVSQLSRFENGQSMISISSFHEVLRNLNTSPEEFYFLLGDEHADELQRNFDKVEHYVNNKKYHQLALLRDELTAKKPAPYSWDRFMLLFVESLLALNADGKPHELPEVLDYLMQVDDWGEMELRIYAIFGFVLDIETNYMLMKTAVKKSKIYQSLPQDMKLLFTILANNFSLFIFQKRYDYAEETLRLFEKQLENDIELIDPHLDLLFNKGIFAFTQNKPEEAKAYCEQVLELCRLFKQGTRGKTYRDRYKNWSENYLEPTFRELTIKIGMFD